MNRVLFGKTVVVGLMLLLVLGGCSKKKDDDSGGGGEPADGVIDQQQTQVTNYQVLLVDMAQSFKPSCNCHITKAYVYLGVTNWGENFYIRLKSDNSNSPGTTLKSVTIADTEVPEGGGWIEVDWGDQSVTKDTRYWIYIESIDNSHKWGYKTGNPYARGNAWSTDVENNTDIDFMFKIFRLEL